MEHEEQFQLWEQDSAFLPEIGRLVSAQHTEIRLRLPRAVADRAVAIWQRPESEDALPIETPEQRSVRHRAASVAFIGPAIEETGIAEDEDVVFKVDAWFVGEALQAADEAGLLNE